MSGIYKAIAAALILMAGLGIVANASSLEKIVEEEVTDIYPGDDDLWGDQGDLTNLTTTADGGLEIADGETAGTFDSNKELYDNIEVLQVITDVSNLNNQNSASLTLTVYDDKNAAIYTETFDLQEGRNSVDTLNFQNRTVQSYDIQITETRDQATTTSPTVNEVTIDGTNQNTQQNQLIDTTIVGVAAVVGAIIVLFAGS